MLPIPQTLNSVKFSRPMCSYGDAAFFAINALGVAWGHKEIFVMGQQSPGPAVTICNIPKLKTGGC